MSCPRTWEVEAVEDGRLAGAERASLERHLPTCAECRTARRDLLALHATLRALPEPQRTPLEAERLRGRLLREANERTLRPRRRMATYAIGAGALAAVGALALLLRTPERPPFVVRAEPVAPVYAPDLVVEAVAPLPTDENEEPPATAPLPPALPPALFDQGVASFRHGNFGHADEQLAAFARTHPRDPRCEDAAYLRAVAHLRMGDQETATRLARAYLDAYPAGLRRAEAQSIVAGTAR